MIATSPVTPAFWQIALALVIWLVSVAGEGIADRQLQRHRIKRTGAFDPQATIRPLPDQRGQCGAAFVDLLLGGRLRDSPWRTDRGARHHRRQHTLETLCIHCLDTREKKPGPAVRKRREL